MKVIENFLDKSDFIKLKDHLTSEDLPWYYRKQAVTSKDPPYFSHCFFNNDEICSHNFDLVKPLLYKLNHSSIIQIRANLFLQTKTPVQTAFHIDYTYKNFKTAILYINESNGPTIIKGEKNIEVYPKQNKILIMDGNTPHAGTTQSDIKRRIVVNVNYYEK